MSRRIRIVITWTAGSLLIALGAAALALRPDEIPSRSEADEYRMTAEQALQSQVEAFRVHNEAWQSLQATEREQILQPIREKSQQESVEMIRTAMKAEATQAVDSCPFRGLLYPDREPAVPVPFHDWEFIVLDYWGGILNGVCKGVYAGYNPINPLQGELAVYSHPNEPSRYELYPTPTATGPIRIIAVTNGLLILTSVRGTFDKNLERDRSANPDSPTFESAGVPGGATYTFDMRTLRYR